VAPGTYNAVEYTVETDWSSAAFWYEGVALSDNAELHLPGLHLRSIQGDNVLPGIYNDLGVQTKETTLGITLKRKERISSGFSYDFTDCPDIAPAVITTCAVLGIHGAFQGLKGLNIKETNRITALTNELRKIGIILDVTEGEDHIDLAEGKPRSLDRFADTIFDSYNDHRMAMAFAPLALKLGSLRIANPDVVSKSYPGFWEEMRQAGFTVKRES